MFLAQTAHREMNRITRERRWYRIRTSLLSDAGLVLIATTTLFTVRAVLEQTLITWVRGAPRSGFSPLQSSWDVLGLFVTVLAVIWAMLLLTMRVGGRWRISRADWTLILVLAACCGVRLVSCESWMLLTARIQGTQHVPKDWIVSVAANGEIRLLEYLLANGVDVGTRAQYGESALGAAAAAGQIKAAQLLIARGARLDDRTAASRETPLTEAAQMNRTDMVKLLLDSGANPKARDAMGRTALDWAQRNGNTEMIRLIQERTDK